MARDKEWQAQYNKAYRKQNRDRLLQQEKIYREKNREQKAARDLAWQRANREKYNQRIRDWRNANVEHSRMKNRMVQQARRARIRDQFVEHVEASWLLVRDQGRCHICLTEVDPTDWHVEHVVPLVKGGTHEAANLAPSHGACNQSKGAKILSADPVRLAEALEARLRHQKR